MFYALKTFFEKSHFLGLFIYSFICSLGCTGNQIKEITQVLLITFKMLNSK